MSDEGEGEILMGRWDCPACGTTGILGDAYSCSGCASPRPEDVEFYLPENAEVITDAAGIAAAKAGSDWRCEYCDSWMPATVESCQNCGGGDAESGDKQKVVEYASESQVPRSSADADAASRPREASHVGGSATASTSSKKGGGKAGLVILSGLVGMLLCCCLSVVFLGGPSYPEGRIEGHRWVATVTYDEYSRVDEQGWTRPAGAMEVREEVRVHHTDEVVDRYENRTRMESYEVQEGTRSETYTETVPNGTRRVKTGTKTVNLGNGRFKQEDVYKTVTDTKTVTRTRQVPNMVTKTRPVTERVPIMKKVPVKKTHYTYRIDKWVRRSQSKRGDDRQVSPPVLVERTRDGPAQLGDIRIVKNDLELTLIARTDAGQVVSMTLAKGRWESFAPGDRCVFLQHAGEFKDIMTPAEAKAHQAR